MMTAPLFSTEIVLPILHLNGDRATTLLARLESAVDAVAAALDALQATAPHGRNYYPVPGQLERATQQYTARKEHLQHVFHSLMAEIRGIQNLV